MAYIAASAACLLIAVGAIVWIARDESRHAAPVASIGQQGAEAPATGNQADASLQEQSGASLGGVPDSGDAPQDMATVQKEESSYTIQTKQDASKAMNELDGLVRSAGDDSSL